MNKGERKPVGKPLNLEEEIENIIAKTNRPKRRPHKLVSKNLHLNFFSYQIINYMFLYIFGCIINN